MPPRKKSQEITLEAFTTLNTEHPTLIKDEQFADTQNMIRGNDGLWENRKGIHTFGAAVGSALPVHSVHFWQASAGTRFLTVGSDTTLYSYAEGTTYDDGTFTARQAGFTAGQRFEFGQYRDNLIATNGVEAMYSTTNNTAWTIRNGANTRIAKYILFANDIGHCTDVVSNRSTHYYGSANPANPWEFANAVAIEQDNGQVINGMSNLGPIIIDFKENSIYDVDVATPARNQLDAAQGTVSHRSIVKAENNIYFASKDGYFTLAQRQGTSGSLAATPISFPIQTLWDTLINKNLQAGIYNPSTKRIYWSAQTSTERIIIVYDVRWNSWSYYSGLAANDFAFYKDSSGDEHLIYGDAVTDRLVEMEYFMRSDNGSDIFSTLLTKRLNFGTDKLKTVQEIWIAGYGSTLMELLCEIYFDDETVPAYTATIDADNFTTDTSVSSSPLGNSALGDTALGGAVKAGSDLDIYPWVARVFLERTFRTVQVRLSNYQNGVRWKLKNQKFIVNGEAMDLIEDDITV